MQLLTLVYCGHAVAVADVTGNPLGTDGVARRVLMPADLAAHFPADWFAGGGYGCLVGHSPASGRAVYTQVEVGHTADGVIAVYPCPPAARVWVGGVASPPLDPESLPSGATRARAFLLASASRGP